MRIALIALLLLNLAFACTNEVSLFVPAVIGNGGSLVNLTIATAPGDGEVFVSVSPRIGISTQDSIEGSVEYAKIIANRNCDVYIKFDEKTASFVDGPSAGAAMTVMTYAALTNSTLRKDTIITGAIDRYGNVGPVGGLYEKAKSAAKSGARYFITPVENFYEMLLLENIEIEKDLEIIEAKNINEIIEFMINGKPIEQVGLESRKREIINIKDYNDEKIQEFRKISQDMIDLESNLIGNIKDIKISDFFDNEVLRQKKIQEQGYGFSSANEAFLNYIEMKTIIGIESGNVDFEKEKMRINSCVDMLERPEITQDNYEYVIGADLRKQWAYDRIDNNYSADLLQEEKFFKYNELLYSEAWCKVAKTLLENKKISNGEKLDENSWKELAEEKIDVAANIELSPELQNRLNIARNSFDKGLYGASIIDSIYVIESKNAEVLPEDYEEKNLEMKNEDRNSMWGNVYQSHGVFLFELNESEAAYRTFTYSKALDEVILVMSESKKDNEINLFAIIGILLFILLIGLAGKVYAGRNNNRYRKRKDEERY